MDDNIRMIADTYGLRSQTHMLVEEMGELTQACMKSFRVDGGSRDSMIEELADVSICLKQVIYLMDCADEVKAVMERKVARQIGRIKKGE